MRNNVLQSSAILDDVSWSKHRHMSVNMNRRRLMDGRGRSHLQWSSYRINANNQDRDNIPGRKHPWAQRSQFVQSDVCLHAIEVIPCVVLCFVSLRIRVIVLFCWLVIQFQYRKPSSAGSQIFSPGPIRSMLFGVGPESLSYDINGLEINQTNNNKKSYSTMWSRILSALNHSDALSWRSRVIRMSFFFRFVLFVWCMQLIMATTTTTTSTIHLNVHQPEFHRDKKNIAFGHGGIGGPQKKTYQNDWRDICGPGHRARILCKYITTRHNSTASSNN